MNYRWSQRKTCSTSPNKRVENKGFHWGDSTTPMGIQLKEKNERETETETETRGTWKRAEIRKEDRCLVHSSRVYRLTLWTEKKKERKSEMSEECSRHIQKKKCHSHTKSHTQARTNIKYIQACKSIHKYTQHTHDTTQHAQHKQNCVNDKILIQTHHWNLRRAFFWPGFLRSTIRVSRVSRPSDRKRGKGNICGGKEKIVVSHKVLMLWKRRGGKQKHFPPKNNEQWKEWKSVWPTLTQGAAKLRRHDQQRVGQAESDCASLLFVWCVCVCMCVFVCARSLWFVSFIILDAHKLC